MSDNTDQILIDARQRLNDGRALSYVHVLALARDRVRGASVVQLAADLGISRTAVYRAINGRGECMSALLSLVGVELVPVRQWIALSAFTRSADRLDEVAAA